MAGTTKKPQKRAPAKRAPKRSPVPPQSVVARITQLEVDRDILAWLHEELLYQIKVAAAQQMLQNPQVQDQLKQELIRKMTGAA